MSVMFIGLFTAGLYCLYTSYVGTSISRTAKDTRPLNHSSMDYSSDFSNRYDANLSLHTKTFEHGEAGRSPSRY